VASSPGPFALRPLTPEQEAVRQKALLGYQRFFTWAVALSLLLTVVGVVVGIVALHGPAQAVVLAALGGGGLFLALMFLVIRRRIGTGPKGIPPRWVGIGKH
jgi:TRAP-type uncharacterized transport system fused permease subunit